MPRAAQLPTCARFAFLHWVALTLFWPGIALSQTAKPPSWTYTLVEGTVILDDCLLCGRPAIPHPLRGTMTVTLIDENPLFARYAISNIDWTDAWPEPDTLHIKGTGTWTIGGEVALIQTLELDLDIQGQARTLTNDSPRVTRSFPNLATDLTQSENTPAQFFTLELKAAPFRELWFSTANNFTSARGFHGTAGDLLADTGRIVTPASTLLANLGFMPPTPPLPLDAFDVTPGGDVWFSLGIDQFSETLGWIRHGDVVTEAGRIAHRNEELLRNFGAVGPGNPGLDAIHWDQGITYFSLVSPVYSQALGKTLGHGDVLSISGSIYRSQAQLMAFFHAPKDQDFGLDALYLWPHGEIWFSTTAGFQDAELGPIQPGDLLSDHGYIVFRNLTLMNPFQPLEDLADFGLDGLFVITDTTPRVSGSAGPVIDSIHAAATTGDVQLEGSGRGRVFQWLRAPVVTGPFVPVSPILHDPNFTHSIDILLSSQGFYILRQW